MSRTGKTKREKKTTKIWLPLVAGVIIILLLAVLILGKVLGRDSKKQTDAGTQSGEEYNPLDYVELGQYTELKVSLKVTEEDLQSEIESLQEEHAVYEQLSGTVQDGDMVYADFEGYVNGQKMDATCGTEYIEIGSGDWLEGFESGLIGANTGETAVFTVAVPDNTYSDPEIDGQNVEFHVTVHYICGEEILPEYNDEFVQSISKKYKTTKEYNEHLRQKIHKEYEEQKAEYSWEEVMAVCKVKKYPNLLLEDAKNEVLQGYYDMEKIYNCSREEVFTAFGYESEQAFVDSDLKPLAKDTAKEYLIAQAIAAKEGIAYTQEEYEEVKSEEYAYQDGNYDTVESFEADRKSYLENQTLLKTVKNWIAEHTEFTD